MEVQDYNSNMPFQVCISSKAEKYVGFVVAKTQTRSPIERIQLTSSLIVPSPKKKTSSTKKKKKMVERLDIY